VSANPAAGFADEPAAPCNVLDREKWLWHSWFEDFIPPFFENAQLSIPEASFGICWSCGLWTNEAWPPSWNPPSLRAPITLQKARCYGLLGMQESALSAYRYILRQDPMGDEAPACIEAIIEILFHSGNLASAVSFYERMDPAGQELATPESLYLLGQSCYILQQDDQASAFLERVPPDSDAYDLARYTQVQIAFRNGETARAETELQALTRPGASDRVSDVLQEQAQLTLARILFQQEKYEEAAGAFRQLSRSRYFLPEALLGMGWCYEAMGRPAGAISFLEAAGEAASRDFMAQSIAELEKARLYAESGIHTDSFQIFRQTQARIREYITFLNGVAYDPARLANQARHLLPPQVTASEQAGPPAALPADPLLGPEILAAAGKPSSSETPLPSAFHPEAQAFQEEIDAVLQKEGHISPRIQELNSIRDALVQVQSLLDRPQETESEVPMKRGLSTRPTPPLEIRDNLLKPETTQLLDVAFALLDTEYRLNQTTGSLGLTSPEERKEYFQDSLGFYREALWALILETPRDSRQEATKTLERLMTAVRHLPGSLEDRELIMKKLVHTQQTLQDGEQTLMRWVYLMDEAGAGDGQPPRPLLLRLWMIYVRSLIYLHSWEDRSPSVFMLPSITSEQPAGPGAISSPDGRRDLLAGRVNDCRDRLGTALQKEVRRFYVERLASFEKLLTDSELYYAEALLKHQKSLLEELQSLPPDAEEKETQEGPPADVIPTSSESGI